MKISEHELALKAAEAGENFRDTDAYRDLYRRNQKDIEHDAQKICASLTRFGICDESLCPGGCPEYSIALGVTIREFDDSIKKIKSVKKEKFGWKVRHDDVRREWNKDRGLNQRIQKNHFKRNDKITEYGKTFMEKIENSILKGATFDCIFSWINDLYDDACDNSRIRWVAAEEMGGEPSYKDRQENKLTYGFDAERVHRYRTESADRLKLDESLTPKLRPKKLPPDEDSEYQNAMLKEELKKLVKVCNTIFDCIRATDPKPSETNTSDELFVEFHLTGDYDFNKATDRERAELELNRLNIDYRFVQSGENWRLEYSQDDLLREDSVINPDAEIVNEPKALFDDFERAWKLTRGRQIPDEIQFDDMTQSELNKLNSIEPSI